MRGDDGDDVEESLRYKTEQEERTRNEIKEQKSWERRKKKWEAQGKEVESDSTTVT